MFTGLFRRRESDLIEPFTPLEGQKQRQVESLKKNNPTIVELHTNEEYQLNVSTANGPLLLKIYFPTSFPQSKPVITVSPPVRHPWVNDLQHVVGFSELLNFSMHSDIGKIVLGIVEEFQRHPPVMILGNHQPRLTSQLMYPVSPLNGTSHNTLLNPPNAIYTPGSGKSILHLPFPQESIYQYDASLPTGFADLKDLSVRELQDLNDDKDKLQEYIEKMDVMEKVAKEKEELNQINEKLAKDNLGKQPVLEEHKKKLLDMVDSVSSLRQQFDDHNHQQQLLSEQYSPTAIQENLKFAALQAEEESEKIAEDFLEAKMNIEEFLSKFMDKRILSHCRRVKEEKLHLQLMELKKSGF